jgi:hypothetical protein
MREGSAKLFLLSSAATVGRFLSTESISTPAKAAMLDEENDLNVIFLEVFSTAFASALRRRS